MRFFELGWSRWKCCCPTIPGSLAPPTVSRLCSAGVMAFVRANGWVTHAPSRAILALFSLARFIKGTAGLAQNAAFRVSSTDCAPAFSQRSTATISPPRSWTACPLRHKSRSWQQARHGTQGRDQTEESDDQPAFAQDMIMPFHGSFLPWVARCAPAGTIRCGMTFTGTDSDTSGGHAPPSR